jgi:hypothetical protein
MYEVLNATYFFAIRALSYFDYASPSVFTIECTPSQITPVFPSVISLCVHSPLWLFRLLSVTFPCRLTDILLRNLNTVQGSSYRPMLLMVGSVGYSTPLRNLNTVQALSYRPMVLLVGSVGDSSLELTDGWYSILSRFSYGSALHSLVVKGLIAQVTQVFLLLN